MKKRKKRNERKEKKHSYAYSKVGCFYYIITIPVVECPDIDDAH